MDDDWKLRFTVVKVALHPEVSKEINVVVEKSEESLKN